MSFDNSTSSGNSTDSMGGGSGMMSFGSCTISTCDVTSSNYLYRISLTPNAVFVGIFGHSAIAFILTWLICKKTPFSTSFMSAMVLGLAGEILGYVGRIMSWKNQWSQNPFYIQICCLTIAPAFLSAGIYLCLRRIVTALGEDKSRIAPVWYTRIFIPCDLVSLILQATGGALASSSSHGGDTSDETGNHTMMAGLIFQVVTLSIFICLAGDFLLRTYLAQGNLLPRVLYGSNLSMLQRWGPTGFYGFLTALSLSTICIFWRCCFRVAELSDGWTGSLMKRQDLFIGMEGVMIVISVLVLNIWHPAFGPMSLAEPVEMERVVTKDVSDGSKIELGSWK